MDVNWKIWILGRNPRMTWIRLLVLATISFLFFRYFLLPVEMRADAMSPSIDKGSLVWVWTPAYQSREPQRGDVVAIRLAGDRVVRIARVIGMPGEKISLRNGVIFINDQEASEMEAFELPHQMIETGYESEAIGAKEIFVLGDNRQKSLLELHAEGAMGRIEASRVIGRVLYY
jgi:signal peptidase I